MLAEVFSEIENDSELWFIGGGEDEEILKEFAEKDSRIKLLGFKNQTELPQYFSKCSLFVLPSEKEPFGLIINEVMNVGKAIITTNEVGAARDLVEEDVNGWVIKAGDKESLKRALIEAIKDRKRLEEMGKESLRKINKWGFKEDLDGIKQALQSL